MLRDVCTLKGFTISPTSETEKKIYMRIGMSLYVCVIFTFLSVNIYYI